MTTVLVTGATGNVGSSVVHALRRKDVSVRAFVRDPGKAADRLGKGVELASVTSPTRRRCVAQCKA